VVLPGSESDEEEDPTTIGTIVSGDVISTPACEMP